MAAGTMTTEMEVIRILYYVLKPLMPKGRRNARMPLPAQAPERKREKIMAFCKKTVFAGPEALKWVACIISLMPKLLENLPVESVSAGSMELKGPRIIEELNGLLRLLSLCILFSKKENPSPELLKSAGYSQEDVLFQFPKAEFLKPAFTIIRDKNLKCILLVIRGTQSKKDVLTDLRACAKPFDHLVVHDGGIRYLVKGFAHSGMAAAARGIAEHSNLLREALNKYRDYNVKIVGHSLGGGTAALLTYILRGQKEFSSTSITCVTFGPPACMTLELAKSGEHLITTVINGFDFVPAFSTASIVKLRSAITSSPWFNDALDQGMRANLKNALLSLLSLLRPVSSSTQFSMEDTTEAKLRIKEVTMALQSWEEDEDVVEAQPDAADNKQASSSSDATTKSHQFYPPGRIMHMVEEEDVNRIYQTPREHYSKLRLSRTMVRDHYSSEYKKMMKLVIFENMEKCSGKKK